MTDKLPATTNKKQAEALAALGVSDAAALPTSELYDQTLEGRGPIFPYNRLSVNDSRFSLLRPEDDGEAALKSKKLGSMTVIPIYTSEHMNRRFYKGVYEKGKESAPVCYSTDDVVPHASSPEPQARTCKACPMNVAGSGQSGSGRACKFVRPMVVVPLLKGKPMKDLACVWAMNAVTAFGDKSEESEMGNEPMYGGIEYIDMIADAKIPLSSVVCELLFDTDATGPGSAFKILIHPKSSITAEQAKTLDVGDRLEVERMIHPDIRVNVGEVSIEDSDSGEAGALSTESDDSEAEEGHEEEEEGGEELSLDDGAAEEAEEPEPAPAKPVAKKKVAKKKVAKKKAAAKAKPAPEPEVEVEEELELDDGVAAELEEDDDGLELGSLDGDDDEVPDDDFSLE